jgi:hypothetical protein
MALGAGTNLGPYRILDRLGAGGIWAKSTKLTIRA